MVNVAIVNALPLSAGGPIEESLSALRAWLSDRGAHVHELVTRDRAALARSVDAADVVIVGDLRPGSDLMVAATLAASRVPLVLFGGGYSFCEIGTRVCNICALVNRCRSSDRVSIMRELTERAALIGYLSPLHREASESYVGAFPERTMTVVPPALPRPFADPPDSSKSFAAFALTNRNDPEERRALLTWAREHPDWTLDIFGELGAFEAHGDLPENVSPLPALATALIQDRVGAYRGRVMLPGRPVPFGVAAFAFERDPSRELFGNDNLGYRSFMLPSAALTERRPRDLERLGESILSLPTRRPSLAVAPTTTFARPLLWAHNLGLGDSINLLPLVETLASVVGADNLSSVFPAGQKTLLDPEHESITTSPSHDQLDVETARAEHDLIIELVVRADDLCEVDNMEDRWVQVTLARSPNAFQSVHENLLSLFGRAGVAAMPGPPLVTPSSTERRTAASVARTAGIDVDRDLTITIHPGAGARIKCWAPERFGVLAAKLSDLGAKVVIVGGKGENDIVDRLSAVFSDCSVVLREPSLREVAAIIELASVHIGNDSGLTHLAGAVRTPTVAIFGPSNPRIWGPTSAVSQVVVPVDSDAKRSTALQLLSVERTLAAQNRLRRRERHASSLSDSGDAQDAQGSALHERETNRRARQYSHRNAKSRGQETLASARGALHRHRSFDQPADTPGLPARGQS